MSWFTKMLGLDKLTNKNPEIKRAIDSVTKPINDALKAETSELLDSYLYDKFLGFLRGAGLDTETTAKYAAQYPIWRNHILKELFK
jgi:hypothetical protein